MREGVDELHEALKASELKLAKQLDKASLTNLEVVRGVKGELAKLGGCLSKPFRSSLLSRCAATWMR